MRLRSLLFVPADSDRKIARAATAGADALILDLEDSVAATRKPAAREMAAAFLNAPATGAGMRFVRINPLRSGLALGDLCAVMPARPDGIVLPKAEGAADIAQLSHYLEVFEAQSGHAADRTVILPVATETPAAFFALPSYAPAHKRLAGLTWGAEDMAAALGAATNKDGSAWIATYETVRTHCLIAAAHAGVPAIDTLYADYRDMAGLATDCRRARRDGFLGRLAIHPDQVPVINEGFTPSPEEVVHARRVVEAFALDAGVVGLDGKMLDLPHLKAAQKILDQA
jgi:citrate lyase subunit beta/citryl-CoA lyase